MMKAMDGKALYDNNKDFKQYVDKYANQRKLSIEEALSHALVKEVGKVYGGKENESNQCRI